MTEETIFATALDKADPAERAAFLNDACGADGELKRRVEGLLNAHDGAGPFLNRPAVEAPADRTRPFPSDEDGAGEVDDVLGFLAPSTRPESLGRIDQYEVLEILGRGGFGIVFRAYDDVLQRVVAVKMLAPSLATTSPARKRFLREARSSAQIRHENVVQVHGVEELPLPYLVMEFVPGETLQQRIDRSGPLDVGEVLRIGRQIAEGLAAAHATGLIHRDIKPSNVLIEGGPRQRAMITDFGLARAADDASLTRSGVVAGTPMYMAPEQAKGDTLDHRADLFSLGSVLYVMATGRPPFRASNTFAVLKRVAEEQPRPMQEVIPEVPEWFCRIVEKLHAKNPAERYQSARDVADVLADCERQMTAHAGVKDFTHIPAAKRPTPRLFRRFVVAVCIIAILQYTVAWFGEPTFRYVANRGAIQFVPADGLVSVTVHRDGAPVDPKVPTYGMPNRDTIPLEPGICADQANARPGWTVDYWVVTAAGFSTTRIVWPGDVPLHFTVQRGLRVTLNPVTKVVPKADVPSSVSNDGFVPLFNGKDLTGWSVVGGTPATWKVDDGILRASGKESFLVSDRKFTDFQLKMEIRMSPGGDWRMLFRTDPASLFAKKPSPLAKKPSPRSVGAELVYQGQTNDVAGHMRMNVSMTENGVPLSTNTVNLKPHDWFPIELTVRGTGSKFKSKEAPSGPSPLPTQLQPGPVVLHLSNEKAVLEFRKIEIKELPTSQSYDPAHKPLEDLVASKVQSRDNKIKLHDAGISSRSDLIATEIELLDARVQLAEAKQDRAGAVALLEELVSQRQAERRIIEAQQIVGVVTAEEWKRADSLLAEARARLAKAKAETPKGAKP